MEKSFFIEEESWKQLKDGKTLVGELKTDIKTGTLHFKAWRRESKSRRRDRTIVTLEHGWLKESRQKIKFFNSIRKSAGASRISKAMERELQTAVSTMFRSKSINWKETSYENDNQNEN